MTRFALLPPDIQALERRRENLSRRLTFLSPKSRRGRALRQEQVAVTTRLVALELQVLPLDITPGPDAENHVTPASQSLSETEAFKRRRYWWDEL